MTLSRTSFLLPRPQPLPLLDKEQIECLYWRAGALLYMFCHTKMATEEGGSLPTAPGPSTVDHNMIKKVEVEGAHAHMHALFGTAAAVGQVLHTFYPLHIWTPMLLPALDLDL